jgi:hypothetical protein
VIFDNRRLASDQSTGLCALMRGLGFGEGIAYTDVNLLRFLYSRPSRLLQG